MDWLLVAGSNEAEARAEGAGPAPGADTAADRRSRGRPAHERRPRADDDQRDRGRAGVERHTVYAHFPDDRTLFQACSEHWTARHPRLEFETWRSLVRRQGLSRTQAVDAMASLVPSV